MDCRVADAGKRDWDEMTAEYGAVLMGGLSVMGTRGKHVNVLQHLMGYLKSHLTSEDNACLGQVGAPGPRRGLPAAAGAADVAVHQQVYLHPYPKELMLPNHV
jgi:uncharacterized protein YbgA (DUF1722 family)